MEISDKNNELKAENEKLKKELSQLNEKLESETKKLGSALDQISHEKEKYQAMFNSSYDAISVLDLSTGKFVDCNDAAVKLHDTGNKDGFLNKLPSDLSPQFQPDGSSSEEKAIEHVQRAFKEGGHGFEWIHCKSDGTPFPAYVTLTPLVFGDDQFVLAYGRDISDVKRHEMELKKAKNEADDANKAKSTFLSNMSHEIRTPLNSIIGFSEILSEMKDPDTSNYSKIIFDSGNSLLELINDILDLSKVEAGRIDLNIESYDLSTLVKDVITLLEEKAKRKNIQINFNIPDNFPNQLLFDKIRMRQILTNLIGNAIKFTSSGSVNINISYEMIHRNNIDFIVSIKDTGKGIPSDQIDNIFDTFYQVKGQSVSQYGGTGLGLPITKKLVELMNGTIAVKSELNEGSEFIINFKGFSFDDSQSNINTINTIDYDKIDFNNKTIVICDDVPYNLELLKTYLKDSNLNLIEALNGNEVLEILKNRIPDLILTDIKMPVMNGYELSNYLRSHSEYKNIPLVAITASVMGLEKKLLSDIFDFHLPKPINKHDLFKTLINFLINKQ